jgi:hypothetical protein
VVKATAISSQWVKTMPHRPTIDQNNLMLQYVIRYEVAVIAKGIEIAGEHSNVGLYRMKNSPKYTTTNLFVGRLWVDDDKVASCVV